MPQFLPAPTVKPDVIAGEGPAQGLLIHVSQHQYFTGIGVLNDSWCKPFFAEVYVICQFALSLPVNCSQRLFQVNVSGIKRFTYYSTFRAKLLQHFEMS